MSLIPLDFVFDENPFDLVKHWCYGLPPMNGTVAGLTEMIRALMQSPSLQLEPETVKLFPACPALTIYKKNLKQSTRESFMLLEQRETTTTAHRLFRGYQTGALGYFCLFDFEGDTKLAERFDNGTWIKAFMRALWEGAGEYKYEIGEFCRAALENALLIETTPERPPDVVAIENKYTEAIDEEIRSRTTPPPATATVLRESSRRRIRASFLKPLPKPIQYDPIRYCRADALDRELTNARYLEKRYHKALELRVFLRDLIVQIAKW